MKKSFLIYIALIGILFLFETSNVLGAGTPPPPPGGPPCFPPPCTTIPIDGGISILAVAALTFGAKKAYDSRKIKS